MVGGETCTPLENFGGFLLGPASSYISFSSQSFFFLLTNGWGGEFSLITVFNMIIIILSSNHFSFSLRLLGTCFGLSACMCVENVIIFSV